MKRFLLLLYRDFPRLSLFAAHVIISSNYRHPRLCCVLQLSPWPDNRCSSERDTLIVMKAQ